MINISFLIISIICLIINIIYYNKYPDSICSINGSGVCYSRGECNQTYYQILTGKSNIKDENFTCECNDDYTGVRCNINIDGGIIDEECTLENGKRDYENFFCNFEKYYPNEGPDKNRCLPLKDSNINCPHFPHDQEVPNYAYNHASDGKCNSILGEAWCPENGSCINYLDEFDNGDIQVCPGELFFPDCAPDSDINDGLPMIWNQRLNTCLTDCNDHQIFNFAEEECKIYPCATIKDEDYCKSTYGCKISNNRCRVDYMDIFCASYGRDECQDENKCVWTDGLCTTNKGTGSDNMYGSECILYDRRNCDDNPNCEWDNSRPDPRKCSIKEYEKHDTLPTTFDQSCFNSFAGNCYNNNNSLLCIDENIPCEDNTSCRIKKWR